MALDKLVDSTQLDADLTSVANAIRTKGGTSAQLAFPADFVQAIADIPTGGGDEEVLLGSGDYTATGSTIHTMVIPTGISDCDDTKPRKVLIIRDSHGSSAEVLWGAAVYPATPDALIQVADVNFPKVCQVNASGNVVGYYSANGTTLACSFSTSTQNAALRDVSSTTSWPIRSGLWHWYIWGVRV